MKYKDIVAKTVQRAHIPEQQADAAIRATLQALAEQASSKQFNDLLEQLPKELKKMEAAGAGGGRQRSLEDFAARVADLSGVDISEGGEEIKVVVTTLAEAVSPDQLEDIFAELPPSFMDLLPPDGDRPTVQDFLGRVQRAGRLSSTDEAANAARATLSTLADRITAGQAQDIALHLPDEVRTHLAGSPERAASFDRTTFLDRIAAAGQTDRPTAERHARAVLAAVRETVPQRELTDTLGQLPSDIGRLAR